MNRRGAPVLLLWALGCSGSDQIVGVEDLGDADLKVIITRTSQRSDITVVPSGDAYRYRHEPLSAIFDRGDSLKIIIVGIRSAELKDLYRSLPNKAPAELAPLLVPQLGAGEGVQPTPTPTRVLSATIDSSSGSELEYQNVELSALGQDGVFGFVLDACPPIEDDFRVYAQDDPTRVCLYRRSGACGWVRPAGAGACPNEAAIFGAAVPAGRNIFQDGSDALVLPNGEVCPLDDGPHPNLGETHAWRCGSKVIAAQLPPLTGPFGLTVTDVAGADIQQASVFAVGDRGLYFSITDTRIYRLRGSDRETTTQRLDLVEIENGGGTRLLTRVDDHRADLSGGTFGGVVGSGQCLSVGGRKTKIQSVDNGNSLTVQQTLAAFATTSAWTIYGNVASGVATSFTLPFTLGTLRRASFDDDNRLVAFGTSETYEAQPVTGNDGKTYQCAYPVAVAPGAIDLIALDTGFLALGPSALSVLGPDGTIQRTIDLVTPVPTGARIDRVPDPAIEHWVVHAAGSGEVVIVEPQGTIERRTFAGEILAFLPSKSANPGQRLPRVLFRPTGRPVELALANLDENTMSTYVVPPFSETDASVELRTVPEAVDGSLSESLVVYAQGNYGGILNLTTGRSRATQMGAGLKARGIFAAESGPVRWGYLSGDSVWKSIKIDN